MLAFFYSISLAAFLILVKSSFLKKEESDIHQETTTYNKFSYKKRLLPIDYSHTSGILQEVDTSSSFQFADKIIGGHIYISNCNTSPTDKYLVYTHVYYSGSTYQLSLNSKKGTNFVDKKTINYDTDQVPIISLDYVVVDDCKFLVFPGKSNNPNLYGRFYQYDNSYNLDDSVSDLDNKPLTPFNSIGKTSPQNIFSILISSTIVGDKVFILALNKM
jgi:hypothetical protein